MSVIDQYVKEIEKDLHVDEFNIKDVEFPDLVKDIAKREEMTENIYKDKVNKVEATTSGTQERKLPKGWIELSKIKNSKENTSDKDEASKISPYYNPKMAKKILEDRLSYREELNELLGDISQYWDMVYPEDLDYSDDIYCTDEESEDEEEYVEDW